LILAHCAKACILPVKIFNAINKFLNRPLNLEIIFETIIFILNKNVIFIPAKRSGKRWKFPQQSPWSQGVIWFYFTKFFQIRSKIFWQSRLILGF